MPLAADILQLDLLSADPGSPTEGQAWYNTTTKTFSIVRNSVSQPIEARKTTVTTTAPTVTSDSASGYEVGSRWVNTTTSIEYLCMSAAVGAAVWAGVDAALIQMDWKNSVTATTTAALPTNTRTNNVLTASANGVLPAQDGVTLVVGNRLLVRFEATGANNGIYMVTSVGAVGAPWVLTRAADMATSAQFSSGTIVLVAGGTANSNFKYQLTTADPITLNTTALTYALVQPPAKYSEVNAAGAITTTSATDVVMTSMTLTPGVGTWQVVFSTDVFQSAATNSTFLSIYANAAQVTNSLRQVGVVSATTRMAVSVTGVATVAAGQAIDIRWRASAGTSTAGNRSLILIRVA